MLIGKKYIGFFLIFILLIAMTTSCRRKDSILFDRMKSLETTNDGELSDKTIEKLKEGIKKYKAEVERTIRAYENIGQYYKLLAVELIGREMYGVALDYVKKAIEIYPENAVLFQLAGVCSARMAKAMINEQEKQRELFLNAEKFYKRALELDEWYVDALYGLAVLYVFELDRVREAEPLVTKIIEKEKKNVDARFLLARIYVSSGRIEDAIEIYDEIINITSSPEIKRKARGNMEKLLRGEYG
ncbi:MAG: hypothetical protein DRP87_06325 [Spirochaetes bacterium]|mgnify:CR=1 FL=1|nr:MAG: hypothetical protein DRP87_06325 [Spirochaetota bacterium]